MTGGAAAAAAEGLRLAGLPAPHAGGGNVNGVADAGGGRTRDGEHSLARRFAAGEAEAFGEVVALYQRRVERLASRLLGWRGDVGDAVQDVFLAALQHAGRARGDRGLWPWLAAITVNACRTQRRQYWTRLRFLRGRRFATGGADAPADAVAGADETLGRVRDAIERLPRADREAVVLHHLESLHPADVAAVLGTTKGAVEVRLSRARRRLKALLADVADG